MEHRDGLHANPQAVHAQRFEVAEFFSLSLSICVPLLISPPTSSPSRRVTPPAPPNVAAGLDKPSIRHTQRVIIALEMSAVLFQGPPFGRMISFLLKKRHGRSGATPYVTSLIEC